MINYGFKNMYQYITTRLARLGKERDCERTYVPIKEDMTGNYRLPGGTLVTAVDKVHLRDGEVALITKSGQVLIASRGNMIDVLQEDGITLGERNTEDDVSSEVGGEIVAVAKGAERVIAEFKLLSENLKQFMEEVKCK